ncbi:MAG: tetratricopeptide repeat protein [Rhodanobacteraceae bacterium]
MNLEHTSRVAVLAGVIALAIALPAFAQSGGSGTLMAPDYGSGAAAGAMSNSNFNTPESDGRPGVYYFDLGAQAFRRHDYMHAVAMYKVAASWAYKPAEYNLALMYFRGQGVPADRPLGAAWAVLAAERGSPLYVEARDAMITILNKAEFAQTDELWGQLKQTYGDKVALTRAKARWRRAGDEATGSHLGHGMGYLRVGEIARTGPLDPKVVPKTAAGVLTGGSVDGSVAYRQFQQSDNPYSPIFLKNRTGRVMVEPLQPVKPEGHKQKKDGSGANESSQPDGRPHSA